MLDRPLLLAMTVWALQSTPTFAQVTPRIPPAVGAASVSFERRAREPVSQPRAERATPEPEIPTAPPQQGEGTFVLQGIVLDGATALKSRDLEILWREMIGTEVSLSDLEILAERIGARYRREGFILSQAVLPAQRIENGVVTIRVIEGFIDQIAVEGGTQSGAAASRRFLAPVREAKPLRLENLERAVLLTRDSLGPEVQTVLAPSDRTFGAADLTAVLPDKKQIEGFVAVDNKSSRLYGAWTTTAGFTAYDFADLTERVEVLASFAPNDDYLAFGQIEISAPPGIFDGGLLDGSRLMVTANYSRGEPDLDKASTVGGFSVTDQESNYSVALETPFIRTRSENLTGRVSLGYRYSKSSTRFLDEAFDTTTDKLWIIEARAIWDRADDLNGVTFIDAGVRQGLSVGGADVSGDSIRGDEDFSVFDASLGRLQGFSDSRWSLFGFANIQLTNSTLPNSERYGLGGERLGRGFAPGNTTGDSGYGARLELRRSIDAASLGAGISGVELFGFGDWGQARDHEEDRDGQQWETLGSIGGGARIDLSPSVTVVTEMAVQTSGRPVDRINQDRETRFFITGLVRF